MSSSNIGFFSLTKGVTLVNKDSFELVVGVVEEFIVELYVGRVVVLVENVGSFVENLGSFVENLGSFVESYVENVGSFVAGAGVFTGIF